MMRYCLGEAQHFYAMRERYISTDPGRHMACIVTMIAAHDRYVLLRALHGLSVEVADQAAHDIWLAAEAGDSYGEWVWQWCEEEGLDPGTIRSAALTEEDPDA